MAEHSNTSQPTQASDASSEPIESAEVEAPSAEPDRLEQASRRLNFAKLDLSVETIDERISPSETNVFDK